MEELEKKDRSSRAEEEQEESKISKKEMKKPYYEKMKAGIDLRVDTNIQPQQQQMDDRRLKRAHYLANSGSFFVNKAQVKSNIEKKPVTCWTTTSWILTWWAPSFLLQTFGIKEKTMQQAWREKVTLVQIIVFLCTLVGFLTFGFNAAVCGRQTNRIQPTGIQSHHIVISGRAYDLQTFRHPISSTILRDPRIQQSPIDSHGIDLQEFGGHDLSFLFQTVNYNCKGILKPIQADDNEGNVGNYFPCVTFDYLNQGYIQGTDNEERHGCHTNLRARTSLRRLNVVGDIYYNWTDIQKPNTNLVAFNGNVLDLSRLRYLTHNIPLPSQVAQIVGPGNAFIGRDATYWLSTTADRLQIGKCLTDILKVGVVDTRSAGCIISDIVLWVSLAVILGVVVIRFLLALIFGWFISWNLGSIREETDEERRKRREKVLEWEMNNVEDMHFPRTQSIQSLPENVQSDVVISHRMATENSNNTITEIIPMTNEERPMMALHSSSRRRFFPTISRFTQPNSPRILNSASRSHYFAPSSLGGTLSSPIPYTISSQFFRTFSAYHQRQPYQSDKSFSTRTLQEQLQYNFNFDLLHTFMVVTCYSEGEEGLRTTLESLATTDYPVSHKLLLVVCDGIITGVKPSSYVAIADGAKRHNRAKVYAGYYDGINTDSDDNRVPMIVIVKCGTESEIKDNKKPGNRGKRDSQVILMNTMQKVYYGERMCELEYQFCKAIVKLTGNHPSKFETCLMVDADTKVYPDSLARMVACMSRDPYIMGLCGETKIANKGDSWVTAIQAFESIFGGVTCLPGCFCMYRIIAPKGDRYVPIICSSDIIEMYCENIVDTLHKKNLLLLGEDRYLTTLMLRTFPKRK
ncbi:chitin synthase-domain-containing protein [Cokeromyces recurvatus]|uniref:chitin synthase-domain-containing protein n=1 Tax=Cokeromyces recurvatus TaxID=90255 RepID=UPI00221E40A4|nr:chitin synthase-domain-containing protein [Cokeromyces recurvatus]XP_051380138.1 chitin synthase-domain-containing protein [Cokeromyces recurvatus]KAI7899131.1 chitin synthase-domain-containing protein [Cokeromyces recurvatus]KAI7900153.1 chitin synthase-domain-containing protein [Cokeromyces recurvatus]